MFSYQLFLVIFLTCIWQSNELLEPFGNKDDDYNSSFKYIKKLLLINTGYESHNTERSLNKLIDSTAEERIKVRDEIYQELTCSIVLDSCHYMDLIKYWFSDEGVKWLKWLIKKNTDSIPNIILFHHEVIGMLNILYHFGLTYEMNPVWLMYMYTNYLLFLRTEILDRFHDFNEIDRTRLLMNHEHVYCQLKEYTTSQVCNRRNKYEKNDYGESKYTRQLETLNTYPIRESSEHVTFIKELRDTIKKNINNINRLMKIELCDSFYSIRTLSLSIITKNRSIMYYLLNIFGENGFSWKPAYYNLHSYISTPFVKQTIKSVNNGLNLYKDIMQYVILYTSWKYIMEVNYFLSLPDKRFTRETNIKKRLKMYNKITSDSLQEIITFLNLDEDPELKPVVEIFQKPPSDFLNVQNNNQIIKEFLMKLKNMDSEFFSFEKTKFDLDKSYFNKRSDSFDAILKTYKLKIQRKISLDGPVSFLILCMFIKEEFKNIDFKVIPIFHHFVRNYKPVLE